MNQHGGHRRVASIPVPCPRAAGYFFCAPTVIAVATRYQVHPKVPKLEQELSAGCALMAMQMAAQAQGFNGIWRSGWFIFDQQINAGLGLAPEDQLVGFLYLGTPMLEARKLRELPMADFVRRF